MRKEGSGGSGALEGGKRRLGIRVENMGLQNNREKERETKKKRDVR
jgi:hypothetical protein